MADSFDTSDVDKSKRLALIAGTAAVGGVGGIAMVKHPFVDSWNPSEAAAAAGGPVDVDISELKIGASPTVVEWRRRPVWVMRRDPQVAKGLDALNGEVADPNSDNSDQPEYTKNTYRSIKPELLVLIGVCTHLGCSPKLNDDKAATMGLKSGGFFCPCHGSAFDLAGRVAKGVPAPTNLAVPPYRYLDDNTIRIGEDPEAAA